MFAGLGNVAVLDSGVWGRCVDVVVLAVSSLWGFAPGVRSMGFVQGVRLGGRWPCSLSGCWTSVRLGNPVGERLTRVWVVVFVCLGAPVGEARAHGPLINSQYGVGGSSYQVAGTW